MRITLGPLILTLLTVSAQAGLVGEDDEALIQLLFAEAAAAHAQAHDADAMAVIGQDGFLFLSRELRHLSAGPFWGEHAQEAGQAPRPDQRDPLPVILDHHRQLSEQGIKLILVPVPPKAVVYPDKLSPRLATSITAAQEKTATIPRLDIHHQAFYAILDEHGVQVLDLVPLFLAARQDLDDDRHLYCRQDSHWSGRAMEITARALADMIGPADWFPEPRETFSSASRTIQIRGDLLQALEEQDALQAAREQVSLTVVNDGAAAIADRASPIVMLGDSHLLVFHIGGNMHATGAGLGDLLAARLGFPLDVVGVRGSGVTAARVNVIRQSFRDPEYLPNKRVMVWLFAAREFTEASSWAILPLTR